ncbi:hypothetical protein ACHQM5_021463 [Ranunculus cassubicifolius]
MENHGCINGTLEGTNYSSPIPIIGLYIAAGSLVCMVMMLYDVISGFRAQKSWLPCKSFTLNSITLTLLSIASKLPVDLTTSMPSPQDQLSKLCGTTFICVCTGFLMPSLGFFSESECFSNLAAMTIFLVTIFVNTCIQLSTGIIVLFVPEHIIILCCMLLLLMMLWYAYWDISNRKRSSSETNKEVFTKGNANMATRVCKSYEYCYHSNPQLVMCLDPICVSNGIIGLLCSVVLLQAAVRSLVLKQSKFCGGNSDYDWSMWGIVIIQILTVVLGSFATTFRWLTLSKHMDCNMLFDFGDQQADDMIHSIPILGTVSIFDRYWKRSRNLFLSAVVILQMVIAFYPRKLFGYLLSCMDNSDSSTRSSIEWTLKISHERSDQIIEASKGESAKRFSQLISRARPTEEHPYKNGVEVSSLSLVLLVRIAQVSLPEDLSEPLVQLFNEVHEILQFIDDTININVFQNKDKLLLAKAVWAGDDFRVLLPHGSDPPSTYNQSVSNMNCAIAKLKYLYDHSDIDLPFLAIVLAELGIIVDFINRDAHSIQDLLNSMEKLFVVMVHVLLAPLPTAIFKTLSDSLDEEYEDRVKLALTLLYKVEPLDAQIQWVFPEGYNFSSKIFL